MIDHTKQTPAIMYEENGYYLIKNFIPQVIADYLKEILNTLKINGFLMRGDGQVEQSHCVYGNPAFDTFGLMSAKSFSSIIEKNLLFTYTYARIYENGATLEPHTDRPECEHSVTLFLGGEYKTSWPIWMKKNDEPRMCELEVGDAVIYKGDDVLHWRERFNGKSHYQLFMHYVDAQGKYKDKLYDSRPYIGLPSDSKFRTAKN